MVGPDSSKYNFTETARRTSHVFGTDPIIPFRT